MRVDLDKVFEINGSAADAWAFLQNISGYG